MKLFGLALLTMTAGQVFAEENNSEFFATPTIEEFTALNPVREVKLSDSIYHSFLRDICNEDANFLNSLSIDEILFKSECLREIDGSRITRTNMAYLLKDLTAPYTFTLKNVGPFSKHEIQCEKMTHNLNSLSTDEIVWTAKCVTVDPAWYNIIIWNLKSARHS